jgi:hypothetical protein
MDPLTADLTFSVVAWTVLVIFFVATAFWLIEMLVVGRARRGPVEHPPSAVEVRIVTVSAGAVVQATVDALPAEFAAVRVIAEEEIAVEGATVHTVPDEFSCAATRKGRALEWARRTVPCAGEYVLYLDEDTLLREFPGLPDADVVQLSEQPIRSGSWITYLAEMFRMGFQLEQATFPKFRYPLYAWGGGIAIRADVEDAITWDVETLTEDTNFVWRAFETADYELQFFDLRAMNQAPPSVREMIHQRRRWISGAARDAHLLPLRYRVLSLFRNAAWGLVFVSPLLAIPLVTPVGVVFLPTVYTYGLLFQLLGLLGWAFLGYWYYGERVRVLGLLLLTVPVIAIVHAAGAFWAIVQPTSDFRMTKKVLPANIDDEKLSELDLDRSDASETDDASRTPPTVENR